MTAPLRPVTYELETDAADAGEWRVLKVRLTEAISEPYELTVDVCQAAQTGTDIEAFLGSNCVLIIERGDDVERRVCGMVHHLRLIGVQHDHVVLRLTIAPALSALRQRRGALIFQETAVPDILKEVLETALGDYDRTIKLDLKRNDYPTREYCLQHRESDFDFACRLMQEEGIAYFFDHAGETEELVLIDSNEVCTEVRTIDGGEIPIADASWDIGDTESFTTLRLRNEDRTTSVVMRDFDWTQPAVDLTREARATDSLDRDREVYIAGAETSLTDYDAGQTTYGAEDGQVQATLRQEEHKAREKLATGRGNVIGMCPGYTVETRGHFMQELDTKYLVTRVTHEGSDVFPLAGAARGEDAKDQAGYENTFETMPFEVQYRPPRTLARPMIDGPQTATVVGPSGEEVFTDEHQRCKVQFHWDRVGANDVNSSCWIRAVQTWAGAGYGSQFLPRIGMEVVVHFLDGNPDRPIVVGAVYNGANPTPHPLPDEKTKSTILTNTSLGGGGRNELTFEDAAGSELIYMLAQKDMREEIKNDKSTTVDNDFTTLVKNDQTRTVENDDTTLVKNDHELTIENNRTKTVTANQTALIEGNDEVTVKGNRITTVQGDEERVIDGSYELKVLAPNSFDFNIFGNADVDISGAALHYVGGPCDFKYSGLTKSVTVGLSSGTFIGGKESNNAAFQLQTFLGWTTEVKRSRETKSVWGSVNEIDKATKYETTSEKKVIDSKKKILLKVKDSEISMDDAELTIKRKNAEIYMTGGPLMQIKIASHEVLIDKSKIVIKSARGITLKASSKVTFKGKQVKGAGIAEN